MLFTFKGMGFEAVEYRRHGTCHVWAKVSKQVKDKRTKRTYIITKDGIGGFKYRKDFDFDTALRLASEVAANKIMRLLGNE